MTIPSRLLATALMSTLGACSSGPPVPDWKMNAQSSIERFEAAYLQGKPLIESTEFQRARDIIAGTGKLDLIARVELTRCATRVASLVFDNCDGFARLAQDATPMDRAYAAYLAGDLAPAEVALLPEQHRAATGATTDTAAAQAVAAMPDPLARLVAAGVLLRSHRATPALLATAVTTASDQGWRRPLLAWLGAQQMRARQAGDDTEAQRLKRRMDLVEGK